MEDKEGAVAELPDLFAGEEFGFDIAEGDAVFAITDGTLNDASDLLEYTGADGIFGGDEQPTDPRPEDRPIAESVESSPSVGSEGGGCDADQGFKSPRPILHISDQVDLFFAEYSAPAFFGGHGCGFEEGQEARKGAGTRPLKKPDQASERVEQRVVAFDAAHKESGPDTGITIDSALDAVLVLFEGVGSVGVVGVDSFSVDADAEKGIHQEQVDQQKSLGIKEDQKGAKQRAKKRIARTKGEIFGLAGRRAVDELLRVCIASVDLADDSKS